MMTATRKKQTLAHDQQTTFLNKQMTATPPIARHSLWVSYTAEGKLEVMERNRLDGLSSTSQATFRLLKCKIRRTE